MHIIENYLASKTFM